MGNVGLILLYPKLAIAYSGGHLRTLRNQSQSYLVVYTYLHQLLGGICGVNYAPTKGDSCNQDESNDGWRETSRIVFLN